MSGRAVVLRYAKALYEVASEKRLIGTVAEDLLTIKEIMGQAGAIRAYCLKLHANRAREMLFVDTAFIPYVSPTTGAMLKIAVRNGRLAALPYLAEAFQQIRDAASGTTEVIFESARVTEENQQRVVKAKMEARLGQKIRLNSVVAPGLLGGFRILWNNRLIDMSAAGRLKRLRAFINAV